jgi:hypothetical protein
VAAERGQATIEWVGLVLLAALALAALAAVLPAPGGGRTLGEAIAHALVCAVRGGCAADAARGDTALVAAYGARDAALVRRYAPNIAYEPGTYTLPVDWRQCRSHRCSDAPDRASLDVHRSARGGVPATAFTHVVHTGGQTYVQYWFYYPDSTTTWGGAAGIWHHALDLANRRSSYPGYHLDDWEGVQVRIDAAGRAFARATAHHGYEYCKGPAPGCANRWGPWTGWTRVSRGSHAGHIPMVTRSVATGVPHGPHRRALVAAPVRRRSEVHERVTTAPELRLVPLEAIDPRSYRSLEPGGIVPPWGKLVYRDPRSRSTG